MRQRLWSPRGRNLYKLAEVLGVSEAYLSRPDVEDPSYGLDEAPYLNAVRMRHGQKGAGELEDLLDGVKTMFARRRGPPGGQGPVLPGSDAGIPGM